MPSPTPRKFFIADCERHSLSESSTASSEDDYTWTGGKYAPHPCPTCKKGWIDVSSLPSVAECREESPSSPVRFLWDKVSHPTWISRSLHSNTFASPSSTMPPQPQPHVGPSTSSSHSDCYEYAKSKPVTRSILSGTSRGDGDSLASKRCQRSVKFSDAPIVYYDYDMILSATELQVPKEERRKEGVFRRLARWIRRASKSRIEPGREPPVISGPYRLWNTPARSPVDFEVGKHSVANRKRRLLKAMFMNMTCT